MPPMNKQMVLRSENIASGFAPSTSTSATTSNMVETGRRIPTGSSLESAIRSFYRLDRQAVQAANDIQTVQPRRMLIAGDVDAGYQLARKLKEHFPKHYSVVGFVSSVPGAVSPNGIPVLGHLDELADLAKEHKVDDVLVADFLIPDFEQNKERIAQQTSSLREDAARIKASQPSRFYDSAKRAADIAFSLTALIAGAPFFALLALVLKITSPGPVLFAQERVGLNGKRFNIYKFRTMRVDAEAATGPVLAKHRDSRCTPIGAILRATHIDELPQLFNVLRGDMSAVGPRPERPCFVDMYEEYIPEYYLRHTVLPGLTGIAQTSDDHLTHVNVKLHYDLTYVNNRSLLLDACLFLRTPLTIIKALRNKKQDN